MTGRFAGAFDSGRRGTGETRTAPVENVHPTGLGIRVTRINHDVGESIAIDVREATGRRIVRRAPRTDDELPSR